MILIELAVAIALTLIFDWLPIRLRLVPARVKHARAQQLAHREFNAHELAKPEQPHRILLFVSTGERYVGNHRRPPDSRPCARRSLEKDRRSDSSTTVKAGRVADGVLDAIAACGAILKNTPPRRERVVILDAAHRARANPTAMQTIHAADVEWGEVSGHRSGGIDFKRLLQGSPGSPDNFELSIVRTAGDYFTPRHRHNFDQVRLCLEGAMNYAPGKDLKAGTVGYFPEGTFYGPQSDTSKSVVLLLQMGGSAGYGFMSYQQLNRGYEKLSDLGKFDGGVFTRSTPDGRVIRKDGYEAIWEHVNGRAVEYPPPRYEEPIVIHPDGFGWLATRDPGFELKHMATFGERAVNIGEIRATRGSRHKVDKHRAPELLFVERGAIRDVTSGEVLDTHSAFRVDPADTGRELEVVDDCLLFFVQLPKFDTKSAAA